MTAPLPDPSHACRVCGYDQGEPPWGPDGNSPTWAICPCCGSEAGLDDVTPEAARIYRCKWLDSGAPWFEPKERPPDWTLIAQLENVPANFA